MLKNKVAVVTGASRGIGLAIVRSLTKEGAKVVATYLSASPERLAEANEALGELSGNVTFIKADISKKDDAEMVIKEAVNLFGRLDILVNNAGITKDNLMLRMSEEEFDSVIETNLKGAFQMSKAALSPMMKQRSGRIINIASIIGLYGNAGQVNYAASKAGLIAMTKSLAKEVGSRSITVNAIAPGFIETAMTDVLSDELKAKMKERISLKRFGTGEDVAGAAVFLASDLASYITGEVISVDGGTSI